MAESNLNNSYEAEMQRRGLGKMGLFDTQGGKVLQGIGSTIEGFGQSLADVGFGRGGVDSLQRLGLMAAQNFNQPSDQFIAEQERLRDNISGVTGGNFGEEKPSMGNIRPEEIQSQIDRLNKVPGADPLTVDQINELYRKDAKGGKFKPFPTDQARQVKDQNLANKFGSGAADESTAQNLITEGPSPEEVAMMEAARSEGQGAPAENAFMEALAEKNNAEGKEQPKAETRAELLEKYKQEFAEATGINIDGKPDNSQALMAMGLSLMQNRAGKGFNVGKMLSAVGEAGEKALPELSKAKSEAKAARVAAGKYALGQIKADEGVEAAIASSELAFEREKIIKEMELREKDKEQEWKGAEVKNPYSSEVMEGLSIRMGRSRTGAKYFDPSNALKKIAKTQRKVNGALETLDQMEVLLDDLGDANTGNAAKLIGDRIKTLMVAGGLTNAKVAFPETGISTEDELEAYQKSVVNEFKRFLTQETGNGISNVDVKQLEVLLGDVSVFTNPLTAKKRLSRIRRIFTGKRKSVAALRDNIMDPRYYGTEQEYLDNVDQFDTLLAGNTTYRFVDDESGVISVEDEE